ncbi:nuclear poly(A) polymerase 3 [Euphorbia lathyris]|uniref:nuclear poly(A) polymerase 3 n=1 Tax=Euphorbia lathyris TaxID=212925 RepID=UPI003314181F
MAENAPRSNENDVILRPPLYPFFVPVDRSFGVLNPRFQFHHRPGVFPYNQPPPVLLLPAPTPVVVSHSGCGWSPFLFPMEAESSSISLLKLMDNEGLLPSAEEEEKRRNVILSLTKIVATWAKKVAWQRQLRREQIGATSATILTYGSYGLGVYGPESDIDALCVGPFFATMADDFFIVLRNMFKSRPEVSDIHCVKDAKVPLMRFKFDGISVDLPYAQLKLLTIPDNLDVLNPFFLNNIDETSWKSLSGVRANQQILQLVPNLENFQSMLRCVKLWAKRRGVYGNLNGFLGGIHIAILAAFICQNHPNANISILLSIFFSTFATWPWPTPVMLQVGTISLARNVNEPRSFMPICLPCSQNEYCHSNITRSTFYKIRAELLRGHGLTKDVLKPDFDWKSVFEPFPYTKKYSRFVKVYLAASDQDELGDWVGWVKSRFRSLLLKLELVQGFCDPCPREYVDTETSQPNVVFYWGLNPSRGNFKDIESVEEDFLKNICRDYYGIPRKMSLSIILASKLPINYAQNKSGKEKKSMKACWKIVDKPRVPAYSRHLPDYLVGYVADTNGDTKSHGDGHC